MNRLTISSAVCAVALALVSGCSADQSAETSTAAPTASTVPSSAPAPSPSAAASAAAESASAAAAGPGAELCKEVAAAKAALNEELKRVVTPDGKIPPAEGKRVMTALSSTLTLLADAGDGELAKALNGLAAEASKAAKAPDPMQLALGKSFDDAGQKVDKVCGNT